MSTTVLILAAGQGKRMRSSLPKVLHPLAGQPLLGHVLAAAAALGPREIRVVHGHGGAQVREAFPDPAIRWVHQAEQRGTGHAVRLALKGVPDDDVVLVLYGDVPLVTPATLRRLRAKARGGRLALLTAEFADPAGYGRIIRSGGSRGGVVAIVEEKDAAPEQRAIREINTGLMACPAGVLARLVRRLRADNAQQEYYLTDVVGLAVKEGLGVAAVAAATLDEVMGINDKAQLAAAGRVLRRRSADALLAAGVTLVDPERIDVHGRLRCGRDVTIHPDVFFEGEVSLGDGVVVGPFSHISNSRIAAGSVIHSHSVVEGANVGPGCEIGPYARLRPETELVGEARIGNFVEVKKSSIGRRSKVNHLSYIGDASVGGHVNVGAGTITCNYDGVSKHRTRIGDHAFIGSGVELVAPVEVGAAATIGAGSTISKDAPAGELTVARSKQLTISGWKRPARARK